MSDTQVCSACVRTVKGGVGSCVRLRPLGPDQGYHSAMALAVSTTRRPARTFSIPEDFEIVPAGLSGILETRILCRTS
jgi:hypothetical protein